MLQNFWCFLNAPTVSEKKFTHFKNTPERYMPTLKASWKLPDDVREKSKFHENLDFFDVMKKPIPQYNFFYNA